VSALVLVSQYVLQQLHSSEVPSSARLVLFLLLMHFLRLLAQCVGQARKVHETTTLLLANLPNIHRFEKNSLTDSTMNLS